MRCKLHILVIVAINFIDVGGIALTTLVDVDLQLLWLEKMLLMMPSKAPG